MSDFKAMLDKQRDASEVDEMCRRLGAAFVIDAARAFVERKERQAAQEHARWREEMVRCADA